MTGEAVRLTITRRVLARLRRAMRDAGHGTMADVQRRLGLRPSFFSEKPRTLDVGLVLQVLRELEIPVADFFTEVERDRREIEAMPEVPAGAEPIADYYREGKDLEEDLRDG